MSINEYKLRHIKRLKTDLEKRLSSEEGQNITGAVNNYFQKNEIGQIASILRDKFNLFLPKASYERKPLYENKEPA